MNDEKSKLHETISFMARKLEEERRQWAETLSAKDSEIAACKKEIENQIERIRSNEEEVRKIREKSGFIEAENNALKKEIIEIKKAHESEIENKKKELQVEMEKAKTIMVDEELKSIENLLNEERMKWREKLNSGK